MTEERGRRHYTWWLYELQREQTVERLKAIAREPDFDVNAVDHDGDGIVYYIPPRDMPIPVLRALLSLGLNVAGFDNPYRNPIESHFTFYNVLSTDMLWIQLFIDYGCVFRPERVTHLLSTNDAARTYIVAYAARVGERKLAARRAATALLAILRRFIGRDLARDLAARVWSTRRERTIWEPHETTTF